VRILATDIDTTVLQSAARGVYPLERIDAIEPARKRRFFQRGTGASAGLCRIRPELRALVEFRPLNLLDRDYGLERGAYLAVFCRNVMIYFDKPTQYGVLQRIAPLLSAEGRLYAGHSESFNHAADVVASCGRTVYRAVSQAGAR
jgi:chemotaxis protein methyltransferase CheR